jgi:hypothetical protein
MTKAAHGGSGNCEAHQKHLGSDGHQRTRVLAQTARDPAGNRHHRLRGQHEHLAALGRRTQARTGAGKDLSARPERDLQRDQAQIDQIVAFHHASDSRFAYLASLDPNEAPDRKKFNDAYTRLPANGFLVGQMGRYEGFKSSGKLTNIENDALLEKITALYDYDIPKANLSSGAWMRSQTGLLAYAEEKLGEEDSPGARYKMITSPKGKRLSERMVTCHQVYERYQTLIDSGTAVIKDIDKAYPGS